MGLMFLFLLFTSVRLVEISLAFGCYDLYLLLFLILLTLPFFLPPLRSLSPRFFLPRRVACKGDNLLGPRFSFATSPLFPPVLPLGAYRTQVQQWGPASE